MKYLKILFTLVAAAGVLEQARIVYNLRKFAIEQSEYGEFLDAKVDCTMAIANQTRYDLIRDQGASEHKKFLDRNKSAGFLYNTDLQECAKYHGRYTCWFLNPLDDVSLDNCGERYGYTKAEITLMKQTHKLLEKP